MHAVPDRPVLYSVEEAQKILPQVRDVLKELRTLRGEITRSRDRHDVEEITSFGMTGRFAEEARKTMDECEARARQFERKFERRLKFFEEHGCELKGLEPGLVDFCTERDGELAYLCWREDEPRIAFWHTLTGGFAGRKPL